MSTRPRHFRSVAAAAGAVSLAMLLMLILKVGSYPVRQAIDDLGAPVTGLIASAACALAAARARGRRRWGWALIAASALLYSSGDSLWSYYELVVHNEVPFPSLDDLFYVPAYPFSIAGVVLLTRKGGRGRGWLASGLDAVILAGGLFVVSWQFVLEYVYQAGGDTPFSFGLALYYPIGDLAIAATIGSLLLRGKACEWFPMALVAAGLSAAGVADSAMAALMATNQYATGVPTDAGWIAGYLLVALGAFAAERRPSGSEEAPLIPRFRPVVISQIVVCVAVVAMTLDALSGDGVSSPSLVGLALMVFALVARNALVLRAYASATDRLTDRERELARRSTRDHLTGLANGGHFREQLDSALRRGGAGAVLFIDLDNFKEINDERGHRAGDVVLQQIAAELRHCTRDADTVGRLGGDEFGVMLAGAVGVDEATAIADRIVSAVEGVSAGCPNFSASIGVAVADGDVSASELLRRADTAMYQAKRSGKASIAVWRERNDSESGGTQWRTMLERAMDEQQFVLHYQPIVDMATRRVTGHEALLRWLHPTDGLIPPDRFIPDLEATDLIVPVGEWIVAEATRQCAEWRAQTGAPLVVHVNVSWRQLRRASFADRVQAALEASGLPASALVIELTESSIIADSRAVAARLHALHRLGVRIALDDFGTGYSSLAHLRDFPVDEVKIDRSLVTGLTMDSTRPALARAVLQIAQSLGLVAIAEGVENADEALALQHFGCEFAQGYHYAKPTPAAAAALQFAPGSAPRPAQTVTAAA